MNGLRIGSLFSGYGGLDLGAKTVFPNARTVWVSDIEPGPCRILAHRFPNVPNLGDITAIDWAEVEPVDVICGGSPCQDLSAAGRRAGMMPGTRSGLWESMVEAIRVLQPSLVVWEKVRGALSADAYSQMESREGRVGDGSGGPVLRALGRVLGDLTNCGYDSTWGTFRASDIGAPHKRERVFVIAHPNSHLFGEHAGEPFTEERPRQVEGNGPADSGGRSGTVKLFSTPVARDYKGVPQKGFNVASLPRDVALLRTPCAAEADGGPLHPDVAKERGQTLRLTGQILALTGSLLPTPKAGDADFGLPRTSGRPPEMSTHLATRVAYADWGDYAPAVSRWEQVSGRPAPAPIQPSKTGKPQLSPAFVEWMMGLPEGWVTGVDISRAQQLRALGNGVVPQQAEKAVGTLLAHTQQPARRAA